MSNKLLELVMIVKNSGDLIIETLNQIKPILNYYTILDTGSSDNTIQNIKNCLKGIDGNIFQENFIDFSTSRNRSLDLSKGNCKYQIILDDTYIINGIYKLKKLLQEKNFEGFALKIQNHTDNIYYSHRIIRTKDNIRYKYKVHELLQFKDESNTYIINDQHIFIYDKINPYMLTRTKSRFYNDIKFLKEDLKIYPNDSRILCYLGLLYYKLNEYDLSLDYFNKCINNKDNRDLTFLSYSHLYCIYRNKNIDLYDFLEQFKNTFSDRAEPLFFLALYLMSKNNYKKSIQLLLKAIKIPIPNTLYPVNTIIYTKEIPFLLCENLFLQENYDKVSILLKKYYKLFPDDFRLINMIYHMTNSKPKQSIELEKPVIVFCAKSGIQNWSPNHITSECSGSEIMLINLSKKLSNDYRVFVFGDVIEGNYEGVEYYRFEKLFEFCNNYKIHTYIVSRLAKYLLYLPNITNVLLWIHDTGVGFDYHLQYHKTKLKKILCLCNWHKNKIKINYSIPDSYLDTTFNAIDLYRFNKKVDKIPYRFIYSSDIVRGLDNLLQIIPKIKNIFSKTTLYIFTNTLPNNLQVIVDKLDYVFYSPRVTQQQIAIEYLKSDIWLYPTNFLETFCITALEAQLSGLLCITTNKGSLSEIVGNRGIIVDGDPSLEKTQDIIVKKLQFVLKNSNIKDNLIQKGKEWAKKYTINNLANQWKNNFL